MTKHTLSIQRQLRNLVFALRFIHHYPSFYYLFLSFGTGARKISTPIVAFPFAGPSWVHRRPKLLKLAFTEAAQFTNATLRPMIDACWSISTVKVIIILLLFFSFCNHFSFKGRLKSLYIVLQLSWWYKYRIKQNNVR